MFDAVFHADWSINAKKRWLAKAERLQSGWLISSLEKVQPTLVGQLQKEARDKRVLAGFDFPIGVPAKWAEKRKLGSFPSFLDELAKDSESLFFKVAGSKHEISLKRPFYPATAKAGVKQEYLFQRLGFQSFSELRRTCEARADNRQPACPLFWTLGANQVGKGAISGWQKVVIPCVNGGARLWPFDGELGMESPNGLTIAETYPAEMYGWLGAESVRKAGKRKQDARKAVANQILTWASLKGVSIASPLQDIVKNGFGEKPEGEDPFDAFCGVCGMIEVALGCRHHGAPTDEAIRKHEGWILGLNKDDLRA
ncbi:MAG: hypothetical protein LW713_05480 [Acetobacteraceae bacterium]|jgi:hypothetical protein|nr:hypothetical protein [Acetobacteraceae bacterium]